MAADTAGDVGLLTSIDFARSFLTFRIDADKKPPRSMSHPPPYPLNNARIQIECRCRVTDRIRGGQATFVLGANCKTERVGVPQDIWLTPNADFVPVFSADEFLNIKTYPRVGMDVDLFPPTLGKQSDRQVGRNADAFDGVRVHLQSCSTELLERAEDVVDAVLANQRLIARTSLVIGRYAVDLDYPVRTINANERDGVYQTDTGPVVIPAEGILSDGDEGDVPLIARLQLAFVAFNSSEWGELLLRVPTEVADGIAVYHFDRAVRYDGVNQLFRIVESH